MISCSGLYIPLLMMFCAACDAASCAASSPPAISARFTYDVAPSSTGSPRRFRIRVGANISVAPTAAPSKVDAVCCPSVAPSAADFSTCVPAPAPIPRPYPATRPARPNGPVATKGRKEPVASPNLRPTVSSYPGAAANGALAAAAVSLMYCCVAFSCSSGSSADIPVPACSTSPIAPGTRPLKNSLVCPPNVVSFGAAGACSDLNASGYICCARAYAC